uniref:Uncharacterized protein n=1 Tax=viral metagenome TaxID=1070528 RepID=A0A6M3JSC2_9ZZZZ
MIERVTGKNELYYFEKIIEEYEVGNLDIDDDKLIDLTNGLLDFNKNWGLDTVLNKFNPGCDFGPSLECETCHKLGENQCGYTKAIGLAVYVYRNLIKHLPEDYDLLCEFLSEQIERNLFEA